MTDLEFAQRCASGGKEAWDDFIGRYSNLIYNYINNTLKFKDIPDSASDIFQEILLSLSKDNFKKLKSFQAKNGSSLATWLRQVTVNHTIDYIRKIKPAVSLDAEDEDGFSLKDILSDDLPSGRSVLFDKERLSQLEGCIEKLDTDDKFFMELHINRSFNLEELKRVLRLSRGAVDMQKSRIIAKLKDCFKRKGFSLDV